MISALFFAACAAIAANGFVLLSAQKGDVLDFLPGAWNRLIGFPESRWSAKLARLAVCPKCVAGQFAIWGWPVANWGEWENFALWPLCVLAAVSFARITEKLT